MWSIQPFCVGIVGWLFDQGYSDVTDVEPLCSLTVQSLDPHRSSPQQSGQRRSQNMVTNFVLCLSFIFFFCLFVLDIFYQNKRSIEYGIAREVVHSYTYRIRTPPKGGRYWNFNPQRPWDFPRAKPVGNLEGQRKSQGRSGLISQYLPSFGGLRTFSSS